MMSEIEEAVLSYEYLERWQGGLNEEDRRELEVLRRRAAEEEKQGKGRKKWIG
jgi:hypothetical protein